MKLTYVLKARVLCEYEKRIYAFTTTFFFFHFKNLAETLHAEGENQ